MSPTLVWAIVSAAVSVLALVFGIVKWVSSTRKRDIEALRTLNSDSIKASLGESRRQRAEDLETLRKHDEETKSDLRDYQAAAGAELHEHRKRTEIDLEKIDGKLDIVLVAVTKFDQWKGDHEAEDDRAHAKIVSIAALVEEHGKDLAVLKARRTREHRGRA